MTIKTNSWHYAWYTFVLREAELTIKQANLCQYFWLVMVGAPTVWAVSRAAGLGHITPLRWTYNVFLAACTIYFFGFIGYLAYQYPLIAAIVAGSIVGGVAVALVALVALIFVADRLEGKRVEVPGTVKLVWHYAWAKKRRICPFLTFEEAETA